MSGGATSVPYGFIVFVVLFVAGMFTIMRLARRPTSQTIGRVEPAAPTVELRQETPAVVSALVNQGAQQPGAVPGTFLDLAARGHLALFEPSPGHTVVYRTPTVDPLRDYEQLFLSPVELATSADLGVALAEYIDRLGFGVAAALEFERAAHAELLNAGFIHRRGGFISFESLTPAGRAAAAHWLGVGEYLRSDDSFHHLPPASVSMWGPYLGYAAALGVPCDATDTIVAAFGARLPSATDVEAARANVSAYLVRGSDFVPAEYGIGPSAPFGPSGPYPIDLRGLLAGWVAGGWEATTAGGVPDPQSWGPLFAERVAQIEASLPAGTDDARFVIDRLSRVAGDGHAGAPLDRIFADAHPQIHRFFADCVDRAGRAGPEEIRRWNILRHLTLHPSGPGH